MSKPSDVDFFGGCGCDTCIERAKHLSRIHNIIEEVRNELLDADPGVESMTRDLHGFLRCLSEVVENYVNVSDSDVTDRAMSAAIELSVKVKRIANLSMMARVVSNITGLGRLVVGVDNSGPDDSFEGMFGMPFGNGFPDDSDNN